jgi:hypothetical protein
MFKKSILAVLLTLCLCFSFGLTSHAETVISIVAEGTLVDVAAFEATILAPDTTTADDFEAHFPSGWVDFSAGKLLSAFDGTGETSLPSGGIGQFDTDTTLGGWELTNQAGTVLKLGLDGDYLVKVKAGNYVITPVPIPSAILLLGGGLISLIAVRRRRS